MRVATNIGPEPSGSIDVDTGSARPRSLAPEEMREPIRPPPMTMVSSGVEEGGGDEEEEDDDDDEEDRSVGVDRRRTPPEQDDDVSPPEIMDGVKASAVVWRFVIARMTTETAEEIFFMVGVFLCSCDGCE